MSRVLIALGGNLGDVRTAFARSCDMLRRDLTAIERSPIYVSSAVYDKPGAILPETPAPDYLDAVLVAQTSLEPHALLARLLEVEKALGRIRPAPLCAPRPIDLDLLLYDHRILSPAFDGDLEVPHPRMHFREFVLAPACDIAADWVHPVLQKTLREVYRDLKMRDAASPQTPKASLRIV